MRILTAIVCAFLLIGLLGYGMTKVVKKADMPAAVLTAMEELGVTTFKGDTGPQGEKGDTGDIGLPGLNGEKGDIGPMGSRGYTGAKGDTGNDGLDGICLNGCCHHAGGCIPRFVEVPAPVYKPRVMFEQNIYAANGSAVTINGVPVPTMK